MNCSYCGKPKKSPYSAACESEECWKKYSAEKNAQNDAALKDPRVAAVREDEAVGRGSCSLIDECYEHSELLEALIENGIETPYNAVVWAREKDGLYWENGLNQMSGEPETDDPIRKMNRESKDRNRLPIKASKERVS